LSQFQRNYLVVAACERCLACVVFETRTMARRASTEL